MRLCESTMSSDCESVSVKGRGEGEGQGDRLKRRDERKADGERENIWNRA
jgi:hypothetical protein